MEGGDFDWIPVSPEEAKEFVRKRNEELRREAAALEAKRGYAKIKRLEAEAASARKK